MKTKRQLLDENVSFPYYLGYSHYMYGLHLWRNKVDDDLPDEFKSVLYREGYDNARHDITEAFDESSPL